MAEEPDGKCPCCDEDEFYGGECGYCGYGKECADCGKRRADREHVCEKPAPSGPGQFQSEIEPDE